MRLRTLCMGSGVIALVLLVAGCNIRGFFVRYEDEPVFHGPAQEEQAPAEAAEVAADAANQKGAAVYARICASCHQANGQGIAGVYPPLAGSELVQGDPSIPIAIVLHGFQGRIERGGKVYNGVMAGWGSVLTDEDIAAVLTYVRSSWGNSAAEITPEQVREVRQRTQGRSRPYTEAELQQPL